MKGNIAVTEPNNVKRNKSVAFKNNAPIINCISKINGIQIDNAEDLDDVPLKHSGKFWRTLNIPLVNCEIELILTWSNNFVSADMTLRPANNDNHPPAVVSPTGLEFQITDTKLYVPVVTLSTKMTRNF